MTKGESKLFSRIFIVVVLVFFINIGAFFIKFGDIDDGSEEINQPGFTGLSIGKDAANLYLSLPLVSKIFLMVQWGLLILLLIYVGIRDKEVTKNKNELAGFDLNQIRKKSETDLDTLYALLKQKQQLRVATVSKAFDIKEDLAMEWGKILESGKLAYIDYPKFGGPLIKIKNKDESEENLKQTKEQVKQEKQKIKQGQKQQSKQQLEKQLPIKKLKQQKQIPKQTKQVEKPKISSKEKPGKSLKKELKKYKRKTNEIEEDVKKQIKGSSKKKLKKYNRKN